MSNRNPSSSPWSANLLLAGIVCFGVGSAAIALLGKPTVSQPKPKMLAPATEVVRLAPSGNAKLTPLPTQETASAIEPGIQKLVLAPSTPSPSVTPVALPEKQSAPPKPELKSDTKPSERSRKEGKSSSPHASSKRKATPSDEAPKPDTREGELFTRTPASATVGKVTEPSTPAEHPLKQIDKPVEKSAEKPVEKSVEKTGDKTAPASATDPLKPVIKAVHAAPLVEPPSKPTVVMTTGEKAWVRLDDQRTVIVKKGQSLPELGAFQGIDGKNAKFESGVLPVTQ